MPNLIILTIAGALLFIILIACQGYPAAPLRQLTGQWSFLFDQQPESFDQRGLKLILFSLIL